MNSPQRPIYQDKTNAAHYWEKNTPAFQQGQFCLPKNVWEFLILWSGACVTQGPTSALHQSAVPPLHPSTPTPTDLAGDLQTNLCLIVLEQCFLLLTREMSYLISGEVNGLLSVV